VDAVDDRGVGAQVHGAARAVGVELALGGLVAHERRAVEVGGELEGRHDPQHGPPAPGDVDQLAGTVDAELLGGLGSEHDRARAVVGVVEESPADHRAAEGLQ
jgi:hypothetical protein